MKLIEAPDDPHSGMIRRRVSEGGLVHMGLFRVLYGFRVRAGFVEDRWGTTLDWCGGGNWADLTLLYSILASILGARVERHDCFAGLPGHSDIKPFNLDREFCGTLLDILENSGVANFEVIRIERPPQPVYEFEWE